MKRILYALVYENGPDDGKWAPGAYSEFSGPEKSGRFWIHGYVGRSAQETVRKHDEFFVGGHNGKRFVKSKIKIGGKTVTCDLWDELAGSCDCVLVSFEASR